MRYCKNCGAEVYDDQDVCLKCGFLLRAPQYQKADDSGSFGWGVLGFCFPIWV